MPGGETEARRRSIVEDVERKLVEATDLGELLDHRSDAVERVLEAARRGHVRPAEAGQVGRNHMKAIAQLWHQIPEHVPRTGKPMQQEQLRSRRCTGLTIEDLEAVHVGCAI